MTKSIVREYEKPAKKKLPVVPLTEYGDKVCEYLPLPTVLHGLVMEYLPWAVAKEIRDGNGLFLGDGLFLKDYYPCLAYYKNSLLLGSDKGFIKVYDACGVRTQKIEAHIDEGQLGIACMIHDPVKQRIISGGMNDGLIQVWQGPSYTRFKQIKSQARCIPSLLLHGNIIVSTSTDSPHVTLWNATTGLWEGQLNRGNSAFYRGIASLSPMGETQFISTATKEFSVALWDLPTHKQLGYHFFEHFNGKYFGPSCVACGINRTKYAFTYYKDIVLSDVRSQHSLTILEGHNDRVAQIAQLGDDIISVSQDNIAKIWDMRRARLCKTTIDLGPEKGKLALATSPEGNAFAVSFDCTKKVKIFTLTRSRKK